ncbi:ketopantoate reductase family protein [Candidatus Electronema sp. JM]|uniref:ketopantoate reductase family protein n=1 Tax=Candidatus Electronema sp. JM TaxID=3401571 RepID=UPI003AA83A19
MKITIIGAGAMGCLFGGLLAEGGQDVCLLDVGAEKVRLINAEGVHIRKDGQERIVRVRAVLDPAAISASELALLCVKHGQTKAAAQAAAKLSGCPAVLTLQNGMGNPEIIAEVVNPERLLCGCTAQGAMQLGLGRIQHSGSGSTFIGKWPQGSSQIAAQIAAVFSAAGIAAESTTDIMPLLWRKLLVNVGINAITALTGIRNGELLALAATRELVTAAVDEAMTVAHALAVPLPDDAAAQVFAVAQATAANRSSMGQDVDARRPTEIEAINGWIVRRAEELGLAVPVNRTLTALVKTIQQHYR